MQHVLNQTTQQVETLDASGAAIIILVCDRDDDIRAAVAHYAHRCGLDGNPCGEEAESPGNIKEVTGLMTVRTFQTPFRSGDHGSGASNTLLSYLEDRADVKSGMERHLLYIPSLESIISPKEQGNAAAEQQQYIQLLQDIARAKEKGRNNTLVIIGAKVNQPCGALEEYSHTYEIPYPDKDEIIEILQEVCLECGGRNNDLQPELANRLAEAMRGFRRWDIRRTVQLAYAKSAHPLREPRLLLDTIAMRKQMRVQGVRGLEWRENKTRRDVGGLQNLQTYLEKIWGVFSFPHIAETQLAKAPQGVVICGLPGCGKTTIAELTAQKLGKDGQPLPLLELHIAEIKEKWVGQSEINFRKALTLAESIAPCVLVVNEMEKLFSPTGSSEETQDIYTIFLNWLEKKREKPVLVMATANRPEILQPELLRKGRFNEIFFAGVPTAEECKQILQIHLKRYKKLFPDTAENMDSLSQAFLSTAAKKERFVNGADIECIVDGAFLSLFNSYLKTLRNDPSQMKQAECSSEPHQYTLDEVKTALLSELARTRTFFNKNMDITVSYWQKMRDMDLQDASDKPLLTVAAYEDMKHADSLKSDAYFAAVREGSYDESLRLKLAEGIQTADAQLAAAGLKGAANR